jgi:hypothetical protein
MNPLPQPDHSDVSLALQGLTERAQRLTRGEAAAIALADRGAMICRASVGTNAPALGCQLDVSTGFSGACFRSRKALRCEDSESDSRVDPRTCRRLGIRSILAAPIWLQGEIVGLLEVFSSQRFAFHDGDLAIVQQLAESALTPRVPEPVPPPKLLFEMEPAWQVFWENLTDIVCPPRLAPLKLTSRPARFWQDVFVPSQLPWQRFGHSILLHGTMLVLLLGLLKFGISQPRLIAKNSFNQSDVIYYAPSEYTASRTKRPVMSSPHSRAVQRAAEQAAIPVRRESPRAAQEQAAVAPPKLSFKGGIRLLRLVGGSTALPAAPLSATTRTQLTTPTLGVAAIAPAPEVTGFSNNRLLASGLPGVVQPAPAITQSIHERGTVSIGQLQVVGPAPDVAAHDHSFSVNSMRSALGVGGGAGVVPPAPAVNGVGRSGVGGFQGTAHLQVVPPAPAVQIANSYGRDAVAGGAIAVVPPPPAVGGLGSPGTHGGSLSAGGPQVVPPAPSVQVARSYAGGVLGGGTVDAVPPSPSVAGLGRAGNARGGSFSGGSAQVVPPAPSMTGAGRYGSGSSKAMALAAVPPSPTTNGLGNTGASRGTQRLGSLGMGAMPPQGRDGARGPVTLAGMRPGGLLPGELVAETTQAVAAVKKVADPTFPETKELNVNFIGPALLLPASSYFLSYEVFIAEEWLARHKSRLIKLVYDFLPYQPRLSAYGPNFPAIENLRATRDPSCDESLTEVESSASNWPHNDRAQLDAKSADHKQNRLPCYRTTADDYRKARTHQPNLNR